MRAMLVPVMIVLSMACGALAEDCGACKPGKVCPTHEGLDDAAIKEATALARDKDFQKRREAVDKLSAAAAKHLNARSKKITNELVKLLSDQEALVKGYAAEALGAGGDEPTAAQALAAEAGKFDKVLGTEKPSKDDELKKWEEATRLASSIFTGLGKLTTQPGAAAAIERGIRSSSPWVGKLAAENSKGFKKSKLVGRALVDMLANYFAKNATDATSAAWTAISMALPEVTGCNDIATQKDGSDAPRWNAEWQKWWRANEKGMK
ncbi:MAG: hypothetical protein K8T20_17355 [Planctomycetes bacterium]|nr:hypothetical protein [Planctomycetota bacterium]